MRVNTTTMRYFRGVWKPFMLRGGCAVTIVVGGEGIVRARRGRWLHGLGGCMCVWGCGCGSVVAGDVVVL